MSETTRRPAPGSTDASEAPDSIPTLTILAHPDPRRVGERAVLVELGVDRPATLSRTEPDFAPPGAVWAGAPLDDPYLSRKPWRIERAGDGVALFRAGSSLALRVVADRSEESTADSIVVPAPALDRGVALVLEERVALWLHRLPNRGGHGPPADDAPSDAMIGASAALAEVYASIDRAADLGVPVLLRGESGTGKELAARALHARGRHPDGPFVAVNLGALPPTLAASELFGHVKGAFTGAVGKPGYFRAAEGGTLFLDEVGEAPAEVQAMLLRALEVGEIVPVGSHEPIPVDVRLVAATDSDLEARARRGDFKEPLLHRLSAYEVRLPALRDRMDDLGRLFVHFAREVLEEIGETDRFAEIDLDAPPWLPADLVARLASFPWPGNVRQLRNVVRQIVIDSRGEDRLRSGPRVDALLAGEDEATGAPAEASTEASAEAAAESRPRRRPSEIADAEVENAMRACDFEPAAAARRLGISRPSLYNLLARHPTLRSAEDVPEEELLRALDAAAGDVAAAAERLEVSARALARRVGRLDEG